MSEEQTENTATENIDDTSLQIEELKKSQSDSITYLGNLLISCVERGGFSIKDVVKINDTIIDFNSTEVTPEKKKEYLSTIFNYIQISQSNGKLTLEEAYKCYVCMSTFIPNNTTKSLLTKTI